MSRVREDLLCTKASASHHCVREKNVLKRSGLQPCADCVTYSRTKGVKERLATFLFA